MAQLTFSYKKKRTKIAVLLRTIHGTWRFRSITTVKVIFEFANLKWEWVDPSLDEHNKIM